MASVWTRVSHHWTGLDRYYPGSCWQLASFHPQSHTQNGNAFWGKCPLVWNMSLPQTSVCCLFVLRACLDNVCCLMFHWQTWLNNSLDHIVVGPSGKVSNMSRIQNGMYSWSITMAIAHTQAHLRLFSCIHSPLSQVHKVSQSLSAKSINHASQSQWQTTMSCPPLGSTAYPIDNSYLHCHCHHAHCATQHKWPWTLPYLYFIWMGVGRRASWRPPRAHSLWVGG